MSPPDRLRRMSEPSSLALILPAFDEEARLGPALDELFGYLGRRGEHAREGAPGAASLPAEIRVLVVDDGSTDGTAALVTARPEANGHAPAGTSLRLLSVPHGGKGAAVRAGMLAADADLIVFADADMATPPDQLPLLIDALADHDVALGSRIQPDGSDMRTSQPAYRRALGRLFHLLASVWVVGLGPGHAVRIQGVLAGGGPRPVRGAADPQHRVRHRAHLPGPAARLLDRHRARSAGRTGAARGCARGLGLALTVAWDLLRIPLLHRGVRRIGT